MLSATALLVALTATGAFAADAATAALPRAKGGAFVTAGGMTLYTSPVIKANESKYPIDQHQLAWSPRGARSSS
jgi:predicted lipoprotein with Yx(FWY)xxD motif